jgi:hypothetical protein
MDRRVTAKEKRKFWDKKWIKGMGIGAFLFFLIKGLVWLAVFFGLFKFVSC